jgi:hypothetical protein
MVASKTPKGRVVFAEAKSFSNYHNPGGIGFLQASQQAAAAVKPTDTTT